MIGEKEFNLIVESVNTDADKRVDSIFPLHSGINHLDISQTNQQQMIDMYEKLLTSAAVVKNPKTTWKTMESILSWIRSTDFYVAPASAKYHDIVPTGLLYHTLKVYDNACEMLKLSQFKSVPIESVAITSLVHDWCKINMYESYYKNEKNLDGEWEQVVAYRVNQKGIPLGHGASSLYLAEKCFKLSIEEALAIRWHNGSYNVCTLEMPEYTRANEEYPLVRLLQFADQLAVTKY